MKISELLNTENKWTKGCLGRDKDGNPLQNFDTMFSSKFDNKGNIYYEEKNNADEAKSFSLYGAIIKSQGIDSRETTLDKLRKAILKHTGKNSYIAVFNDCEETKYSDVKEVLRISGL